MAIWDHTNQTSASADKKSLCVVSSSLKLLTKHMMILLWFNDQHKYPEHRMLWNLNVKTLWVKITTLSFLPLLTYLLRVGRIGFRGGRASPPLGLEVTKGRHALMLCMTVCLYAGTVLGVFPLHRFFLVPPLSPSAHPFGLGRLSRSGASLRNGAVFSDLIFFMVNANVNIAWYHVNLTSYLSMSSGTRINYCMVHHQNGQLQF